MIRVDALTRIYGDLTAVDQVSFEIGQGEIVGLLGHNGAGKTTVMKMLTGYLEPTGGSIEIDGLDIEQQRRAVQSRIGYLPENDPLYPEMTVIDYLDYAAELHGVPETERLECIREAIAKTELWSKAAEPIATLSRGYRQRVGVAQAILHNPKVLILDEPTNGLDPTQVQHMRELIRSLAQQATVIISTHILQEVQAICDRVIIVRNGQKALDATMQELQAGKRLLVAVDAEPTRAVDLFKSVEGVQAVESLQDKGPGHRYALDLGSQDELSDAAPLVASRIATAGLKLYALQPESRDLETIFGEISAQEGRVAV
ncbi:MAG: ATP-binding cassette domain-containing protein [Gammaproteobacteria bacterium]|nr:ATP-binding cassette domain-containing protein [Gammaproteobacteria bacterium]